MLNITLLGSGGGMPMPNRYLSSLLMNYKGRKILIDCGEGTQVAMKIMKTGFKALDIICITHAHGDHLFGLPGLLSTLGNSGRIEPITIIGPSGIEEIINGLMVAVSGLPYEINIIENPKNYLSLDLLANSKQLRQVNEKDFSTENIMIEALELDHSLPCLGYNFYVFRRPKFSPEKATSNQVPKKIWQKLQTGEAVNYQNKMYEPYMVLGEKRKGIKLSYITDTRPLDTIAEFIKDSDLFICEGTYGDNNDLHKAIKNKHMTFSEAAELADKGKVAELLLTHFSPAINEPEEYKVNAESIFKNTIIGYDGFFKSLTFEEE
ncbi:ribonuclease Z [Desulfonispora thiosulfatigenes]|nr:ribonuclease Z [Desulfonispora thiosulfatigenes]